MPNKLLFIALLTAVIFNLISSPVYSRTSDGQCETGEECQEDINKAQAMLAKLAKEKDTLQNQLKLISSQIDLTKLKIAQTQNSITLLETEITHLSGKIDQLDLRLNHISAVFIKQANESYKLSKRFPSFMVLFSDRFNQSMAQYKYFQVLQKNNRDSLLNMETARLDYDRQKREKSLKQQELTKLQTTLASQNKNLASQQTSKTNLLAVTKNDETKYQQLLTEALKQLSQLKNFAQSGGSTCLDSIPSGGDGGWFYSQRDPRWCKQFIGNSSDTIGEVGCFISSLSMVWKKHGFDMTPSAYASSPSHFLGSTAWMTTPEAPPGFSYKQVAFSQSVLDNELNQGRPVIAQISVKNVAGMHFVVIKSGQNGQYLMNDPWYGADLAFSSRYSLSSILSLRLITK